MKNAAHMILDAHTPGAVAGLGDQLTSAGGEGIEAREVLVQVEKLALIGQIAAGIAHEINNPVGYMLSNLTTLSEYFADLKGYLRKTGEVLDRASGKEANNGDLAMLKRERERLDIEFMIGDFEDALKDCVSGADRVRDIAANLKNFSRRGDGTMEMADLNETVERALDLCRNELKYHCKVHSDLEKLPSIPCKPHRLWQVFVNLLLNAAQAVKDKGEVHVSTRVEEDRAAVHIRDTGCGIDPEHMDRLFTPFFTTKPEGQGTGLGLYLSGEIVKAHGGSIEVNSRPGQGTEFVVRLPLSNPGGMHEENA